MKSDENLGGEIENGKLRSVVDGSMLIKWFSEEISSDSASM